MSSRAGHRDASVVGADVLGLVTSGMYFDPLTVYREYVQNAVDAIETAGIGDDGLVTITLAPEEARVTIRDNGPGLTLAQAQRALVPIARSEKRGQRLRGFRGIGRLARLAFAESVAFVTRAGEGAPVVRVVWDGGRLNAGIQTGEPLDRVLDGAVKVDTVSDERYPWRFFEARMVGVSRHAAGAIMNRDAVRQYVGEMCPVPFAPDFRHAEVISRIFEEGSSPFTVTVRLDGEDVCVERPHACSVSVSEHESQDIAGVEEIRVAGVGGRACAALGWIAHTPYRGAITKSWGMRGIRARVGNIQIGGEDVFAHLFSEERYNRWCIGEVHVLEPGIVPNARRDYFEPGVHLRNLENQLGAVCRRLERRCRAASRERLTERRLQDFLDRAQGTLELASSGYLKTEAARKLIRDKVAEARDWKEKYSTCAKQGALAEALGSVNDRLNGFRARAGTRRFPGVGMAETQVYREVFEVVTEVVPDPTLAKDMIEAILDRMAEAIGSTSVEPMLTKAR